MEKSKDLAKAFIRSLIEEYRNTDVVVEQDIENAYSLFKEELEDYAYTWHVEYEESVKEALAEATRKHGW